MIRFPRSRSSRLRREARSLADRGIHRAEELRDEIRDGLPEASDVIADLRQQARPVVDVALESAGAAREKAKRVRPGRRSRSRRPLLIVAVIAVGAIIAYFLLSRRDSEPAYLAAPPDQPDRAPGNDPGPNGRSEDSPPADPADEPVASSSTSSSETNRVAEPVTSGASGQAFTAQPSMTGSYQGAGTRSQSQPQAAAWDLPSPGTQPPPSSSPFGSGPAI